MKFMSTADLERRWIYTRQGVHRLVKNPVFPPSLFSVSNGRVQVWELAQIEAFEAEHPEVFDDGMKRRKQIGYFLARRKGTPEPEGEGTE